MDELCVSEAVGLVSEYLPVTGYSVSLKEEMIEWDPREMWRREAVEEFYGGDLEDRR